MVPLETISLCQTKALAVFNVDVDVEGNRVQAVVDTAAEATLLSDRLFYTLNPPPPFIRPCKIATAGRELSMDGGVVGPVRLKLGDRECTENIYVTPLEDEMLIGFDLLTKYGANIYMGRRTITFQDGSVDSGVEMARSPAKGMSVSAKSHTGLGASGQGQSVSRLCSAGWDRRSVFRPTSSGSCEGEPNTHRGSGCGH